MRYVFTKQVRGNTVTARFIFLIALGFSTLIHSAFAAPLSVIVYGDSIAEGVALPAAERQQAWIHQVELLSNGQFRMINESKAGRPTASLPEFSDMLKRRPQTDILVIALGTNDTHVLTNHTVMDAVSNVEQMVQMARTHYGEHLPVILLGPPNIRQDTLRTVHAVDGPTLKKIDSAFQVVAGQLRSDFVSLYGVIPDSALAGDGVHPNGPGNTVIAEAVLDKLSTIAGNH